MWQWRPLRARSDSGPRVDHRARTDPRADVDVAGHEDRAGRHKRAAPRRGADHSHAQPFPTRLHRDFIKILNGPASLGDIPRMEKYARIACLAHEFTFQERAEDASQWRRPPPAPPREPRPDRALDYSSTAWRYSSAPALCPRPHRRFQGCRARIRSQRSRTDASMHILISRAMCEMNL
jgi:hypothetical protein